MTQSMDAKVAADLHPFADWSVVRTPLLLS